MRLIIPQQRGKNDGACLASRPDYVEMKLHQVTRPGDSAVPSEVPEQDEFPRCSRRQIPPEVNRYES